MDNRKKRPTIDEAKQIDLVSFLADLGFKPERVNRQDHWYISPLRITEKTPSFKVDKSKNIWYDHGLGKGGNIINFALLYYGCSIPEFLDSLAGTTRLIAPPLVPSGNLIVPEETEHSGITIIKVQSIYEQSLIHYLRQRRIPLPIADQYCREIHYSIKDRKYFGIGIENDSNSYEIRNPYAKISSHPKDIRTIANGGNNVYVFEGFMDFLSFLTLNPQHPEYPSDFVILNSVNQFEKARKFMEAHPFIHLFLDNDSAGKNYTSYALSISSNYVDESGLYKGYKDLNDWHVNFGKGKNTEES